MGEMFGPICALPRLHSRNGLPGYTHQKLRYFNHLCYESCNFANSISKNMHDQLSFSDLVETAANLNVQEYERFLIKVNTRRAQKRPDVLSKQETDLLKKIYSPFPLIKKERIAILNAKIWNSTLLENEHQELLQLIEEQENWAVTRMNHLAKLASIQNTDYATLVKQLGIFPATQNG